MTYPQIDYAKYEKTVYWEDVGVGMEIPSITREGTLRQSVKRLASHWGFHEIHFDHDWARMEGLPQVILPATLHYDYLLTTLTDWIGINGVVKKLGYQNRNMIFCGDQITTKGRVTNTYVENGEHLVDLEIWNEKQTGANTTPGHATVALPSRSGS